jgi:hypothetical protein
MKRKLNEYNLIELKAKEKLYQSLLLTFGSIMLLAALFLIYSAITTKNYAFIAIASGTFITIFPLVAQLIQIKKEIQSREK